MSTTGPSNLHYIRWEHQRPAAATAPAMPHAAKRGSMRVGRRSTAAPHSFASITSAAAAPPSHQRTNAVQHAEVHVSVQLWGQALTPFAVVYDERRRALRARTRAEVGRTETITHAGSGASRTFLRSFLVRTTRNPRLRVALFDYVKSSGAIEDHLCLGTATFLLQDVLSGGAGSRKIVKDGRQLLLTLRASAVNENLLLARRSVALRVSVPEMRRKKLPHHLIAQSFDISRRPAAPEDLAWVPVYRSEALALPAAPHERHVRFDAAIIPEWRIYGVNTALRLRLLQHSSRTVRVSAVCNTSLHELQNLDPSRDSLALFGASRNATQCVGRLFLTQAQPTKSGGVFSLTAQYYQFSLSSAKRALSLTMTRLTGLRAERKCASVRSVGTDGSSFGSREPTSTDSSSSIDRLAMRLRKTKVSSDNAAWRTTSDAYVPTDAPPSQIKSARWRSWLPT